jgi:hypothetical protein
VTKLAEIDDEEHLGRSMSEMTTWILSLYLFIRKAVSLVCLYLIV